ncbi:SGNH/GDSL hydrolase family protein [Acidicapsa ligni]|uniref:SGNH/GDSL hydrolase family protein n=1 Tax=Acidicapsa ligni TaxID=542300 RepID=UPI0021E0484D|nr:SGNH/GDSL hydrolase family protein [Acidicapsa ligni]
MRWFLNEGGNESGRYVHPFRFGAFVAAAVFTGMLTATSGLAQQTPPPVSQAPAAAAPQRPHLVEPPTDWPNMKRFHDADVALPAAAAGEERVVFMGDSITESWLHSGIPEAQRTAATDPGFFPGKPYVNRGISGQTTPQMLVRFRQDVVELKPRVVVILAGINDVAGNTGDMTPEQTEDNFASMADLAHANDIKVVLCSILPAFDFPWKPGREPAPKVIALNAWIKAYAASHGYTYVDFYSAMVDSRGGLPATLSRDGVHPNKAGYDIMNPLVEAGIAKALGRE